MKPTKAERVIYMLKQRFPQIREVDCTSRKYRAFVIGDSKYWVGVNGALRTGQVISRSHSLELRLPYLLSAFPMPEGPNEL